MFIVLFDVKATTMRIKTRNMSNLIITYSIETQIEGSNQINLVSVSWRVERRLWESSEETDQPPLTSTTIIMVKRSRYVFKESSVDIMAH